MDPDVTLLHIRTTVGKVLMWDKDRDPLDDIEGFAMDLAEAVTALDGWLCTGGHKPANWS